MLTKNGDESIIYMVRLMKKKNVLNLIKYYIENNDSGFRNEACEIAKEFDSNGDYQLAEYIMALLSDFNTFVPQSYNESLSFFTKNKPNFYKKVWL